MKILKSVLFNIGLFLGTVWGAAYFKKIGFFDTWADGPLFVTQLIVGMYCLARLMIAFIDE